MLAEHGNISVGIDLGRDYSQIAFCSKSDRAPLMVMQSEEEKEENEENDYLIRTPVDLFSLVERKDARGVEVLYQFLKECFALLKGAGSVEHMTVMVTMHEMKGIWADVIRTALLKLGIPSSAIFLQGHLESFYAYLMNQKKELLTYHVALLEYERDCITAWHFWLERKTKPVLAGNAPLASVQAILKDHFNAATNIDESRLNDVSRVVESYSGIMIPANKPIVGENVFTQVAGVHADGDNKNNLYCNDLLPERFGRKREYALGKTSGKANIRKNLEDLGLELDEDAMRKVTERIIELGDKKELVTQEDLPYIVSDVLKHGSIGEKVKLKSYFVNLAHGLKPMATLKIEINGKEYEESSSGDGQYDAFVRALRKIYKVTLGRKFPMLTNYAVTIPPGGRTDAFVQTVITWSYDEQVFRTRGLDADQTEAAIKATMKMLNLIEDEYEKSK